MSSLKWRSFCPRGDELNRATHCICNAPTLGHAKLIDSNPVYYKVPSLVPQINGSCCLVPIAWGYGLDLQWLDLKIGHQDSTNFVSADYGARTSENILSFSQIMHFIHNKYIPFISNGSYLSLKHLGRDKMAAVSQTTLSDSFSWMKMLKLRLKFLWSLFLRVQLTIF